MRPRQRLGGSRGAQGTSRAARGGAAHGGEPVYVCRDESTTAMTVIELVERERARLRVVDVIATVAVALALTAVIIGLGAWLLGQSRWINLPRATPFLVWL